MILESDPCRRLACTWHTFTPEWAAEVGMDEAPADAWRVHDGSEPGSDVLQAISTGWPAVLASLKTLLNQERQAQDGTLRRTHTDGMALDAHAADVRSQLIELKARQWRRPNAATSHPARLRPEETT